MPEDANKNLSKAKYEAKQQRKKRQGRQHAAVESKTEKAPEKKIEKAPDVPKEPEKPAYQPPGPEFYNSLKRETDEILKITEEANSKYKKKEIQSNWAKYEMPIETYDEIDEQEKLGADYESLIQASFSVGGHFQFKHEKSWDITTGPTPYDKYFDINMESLNTALSTIPFYERNDLDKSIFTDSDIQSMDHRATKFKQKYYNDKKYTTPDLETQEKILNSLIKSDNETNRKYEDQNFKEINLDNCETSTMESEKLEVKQPETLDKKDIQVNPKTIEINENNDIPDPDISKINKNITDKFIDNDFDDLVEQTSTIKNIQTTATEKTTEITKDQTNTVPNEIVLPKAPQGYKVQPKEPAKNPVIESPEDLEKWLDDFLDG